MIFENITARDINPIVWRNLGDTVRSYVPDEKYIIFHFLDEKCINAYDNETGSLINNRINEYTIEELKTFLEDHSEYDRVYAFDENSVLDFTKRINEKPFTDLSISEYLAYKNKMLSTEFQSAILTYPSFDPEEFPLNFSRELDFVRSHNNTSMILGIFDGNMPYINLIITIKDGLITDLRTFDYLTENNIQVQFSKECLSTIEDYVTQNFNPVNISLFAQKDHYKLLLSSHTKSLEAEIQDYKEVSFGKKEFNEDWVNLSGLSLFIFIGFGEILLPFPFKHRNF